MEETIDKISDVANALEKFSKDMKSVKKGRVHAELVDEIKVLLKELLSQMYGNGLETTEHEEENI